MVDTTNGDHLEPGMLPSQYNQGPRSSKEERRGSTENQRFLPWEHLVGAAWQVVT